MQKRFRLTWACVALTIATAAPAADPVANPDQTAVSVLKDVHNRGAELYNGGDAAACYRLYEGGLLVVRPFLAHRPAIQAVIDSGLNEVAAEANPRVQAFRLHEVIEKVRAMLKDEITKATDAPKPAPKVVTPPASPAPKVVTPPASPAPKVVTPPASSAPKVTPPAPAAAQSGSVSGVVTLDGRPLDKGRLMIVSLTLKQPQVFTAELKDGQYAIAELPTGPYAVRIDGANVPAKFQELGTGSLRLDVKGGANKADLELRSK